MNLIFFLSPSSPPSPSTQFHLLFPSFQSNIPSFYSTLNFQYRPISLFSISTLTYFHHLQKSYFLKFSIATKSHFHIFPPKAFYQLPYISIFLTKLLNSFPHPSNIHYFLKTNPNLSH